MPIQNARAIDRTDMDGSFNPEMFNWISTGSFECTSTRMGSTSDVITPKPLVLAIRGVSDEPINSEVVDAYTYLSPSEYPEINSGKKSYKLSYDVLESFGRLLWQRIDQADIELTEISAIPSTPRFRYQIDG